MRPFVDRFAIYCAKCSGELCAVLCKGLKRVAIVSSLDIDGRSDPYKLDGHKFIIAAYHRRNRVVGQQISVLIYCK